MARKPVANSEGVVHLHVSDKQPEAAELRAHVEGMWSKNTDHAKSPVFNPEVGPISPYGERQVKRASSSFAGNAYGKTPTWSLLEGSKPDSATRPTEAREVNADAIRKAASK